MCLTANVRMLYILAKAWRWYIKYHFRPYSVEDLQVVDLEFFNSLKYVLDNDPESLALTFSIEEQSFGVVGVAIKLICLHIVCVAVDYGARANKEW